MISSRTGSKLPLRNAAACSPYVSSFNNGREGRSASSLEREVSSGLKSGHGDTIVEWTSSREVKRSGCARVPERRFAVQEMGLLRNDSCQKEFGVLAVRKAAKEKFMKGNEQLRVTSVFRW